MNRPVIVAGPVLFPCFFFLLEEGGWGWAGECQSELVINCTLVVIFGFDKKFIIYVNM
jgi:hypothetical protein